MAGGCFAKIFHCAFCIFHGLNYARQTVKVQWDLTKLF
nr:MAG TPA: hypothetical protein [Caudoviricetes sp.]